MTMYITKVWGFASQDWPLITFSREGVRNKLARRWQPGDTILLVGTQQEPTALEHRGKILGYLEFTTIPVMTREIVSSEMLKLHGDKWPYALLCRQGWGLEVSDVDFKTFLPETAARYPGMTLATDFGELTEQEESRIRQLNAVHEIFKLNEAAQHASDKTDLVVNVRNGGRGPVNFTGNYTVTKRSGPAETYLLEFVSTHRIKSENLMKVGWAYNPTKRAHELSKPLVPEFSGSRWKFFQKKEWDDEYAARYMEQTFIDLLLEHNIEMSGEYFKPPMSREIATSELWQEAMLKTNNHIKSLSEAERLENIKKLLEDIVDQVTS